MKILGAIMAGGLSTRFGSDKALARIDGRAMIDHTIDALRPQVESIVLCGRDWSGIQSIADRPARRIGPLGGLNAALHEALRSGHDAVLCVPVDVWPLPRDMRERLAGRGAATFDRQHLIGFWPVRLATALEEYIAGDSYSLRGWSSVSRARSVVEPRALFNINDRDELASAVSTHCAQPHCYPGRQTAR